MKTVRGTNLKWQMFRLVYPKDVVGTLCARDGIKTGPRTPNGQDAYDKKLIVCNNKG